MSQPAVSPMGLVTGEAVVLDMRPARLGSRSLAFVIDLAAQFLALLLVILLVGGLLLQGADERMVRALLIAIGLLFLAGYPIIALTFWHGRTLGKAALGIRAVRTDGGTMRVRHATVRTLVGLVELPIGIGIVVSLFSRNGSRLGDMFAGTTVVHDRIPTLGRMPLVMPPPLVNWALAADISAVDERLAGDVRAFLGRAPMLRRDVRWSLSSAYADALVSRISPPPPMGAPPEHVLHAVMAERQRRAVMRSQATGPRGAAYAPPPAPLGAHPMFPAAPAAMDAPETPYTPGTSPSPNPPDGYAAPR